MIPKLKLKMGLTSVRTPRWPSEPGFVSAMNAQIKELMQELESIIGQFEDVTPEIAKEALEPTFEKSKVYCPKDTHALVNSGYLEVISKGKRPYVEMGYAKGGNPRYGVYVHEMVEQPHAHPTRSKFLQAAISEDIGLLKARIEDGYREFMDV